MSGECVAMPPVNFDNLHKLIVNYLPKNFTEQDILNLFSVFGKVHSCKLMIDLKTSESKGWCFVNYFNLEDAAKAVKSYNGLKVQNKIIRVSFAGEDASNKAQLFVSGLKKDMTSEELLNIFSRFGTVSWCYIMPKGAALVRFEKREEAIGAMQALNGKEIDSNPYPLNVSLHESSHGQAKTQFGEDQEFSGKVSSAAKSKFFQRFTPTGSVLPPLKFNVEVFTLYVSGLPENFDEAKLYKMFSPYGAIAKATLMTDPNSKRCKGVAFIDMMKKEDAISAIQSLNGALLSDRNLKVAFKTKKSQLNSSQTIITEDLNKSMAFINTADSP